MNTLTIVLVFWSYIIQVAAQRCPVGWLERQEGKSCYRFWPTRMKSWQDARATCQSHDGDLLKLDSFKEKDWIINQLNKYPSSYEWWIGLRRDATNETLWVWTDQSVRSETSNFLQWGSGEPNNYKDAEDCAEIWDNLLNDKNCDYLLQFVCERPKDLPMSCDVDDGWNHVTSDRCYKIFAAKMTKTEAKNLCTKEDAELLTIQDVDTQHTISDFVDNANKISVWLPYTAENATSEWKYGQSKVTANWWNTDTGDSTTLVENATLCSVLDSGVTSSNKNWRPVSCDSVNSVLCSKPKGTCPGGFIQHKSMCYLLNTGNFMTWSEAKRFCSLRQTTLLEIKDEETWFFMSDLLKKQFDQTEPLSISNIWLGITASVTDSQTWTWLSDSTGIGAFEKQYIGSQSSSMAEKCIYVDINTNKWVVGNCAKVGGAVCTLPVDQPMAVPPSGKDKYMCEGDAKLYNKFCYEMFLEKMDWFRAKQQCENINSDLVTIMSELELGWLQNFWTASFGIELWIGLNDHESEGTFHWLNTGIQPIYTNWLIGQPNNAEIGLQYSENCAVVYLNQGSPNGGKWFDYPCSVNRGYICKKPAYLNIAPESIVTMNSTRRDNLVNSCTENSQRCCQPLYKDGLIQVDLGSVRHVQSMIISGFTSSDVRRIDNMTAMISVKGEPKPLQYVRTNILDSKEMITKSSDSFEGRLININYTNARLDGIAVCEISIFADESVPSSVTQTGISKENVPCVQVSSTWRGNISHTVSGRLCQQWSMQSPHQHIFRQHVGDETPTEASNYCRDPLGFGYLWCYTIDPTVRWELCNVDRCNVELDAERGEKKAKQPKQECKNCFIVGNGMLTWGDSHQACDAIDNVLPMYLNEEDSSRDELKAFSKDKLFWMSIYYDGSKKMWLLSESNLPAPSFLNDLIDDISPPQTMCAVGNTKGQIFVKSCFERFSYVCIPSGSQVSIKTSSSEGFKTVPTSFIHNPNDNVYSMQFEFKGYDGAAIKIDDYTIRIGGNLFAKSYIADKSDTIVHSNLVEALCSDTEYKAFWITWSMDTTCFINVGLGFDVGQNAFLQYSNCPDTNKKDTTVAIGTVKITEKVYNGFWKFSGLVKTTTDRSGRINIALHKPATQSSDYADLVKAEKAVDGCTHVRYHEYCGTHTLREENPWWEVDLESVYPISTVVIHRRWEDNACCRDRLGFFQLYISMFSGSTLSGDLVYTSQLSVPPKVIYISGNGKHGRYIRIVVPRKSAILELVEVEVFEDIDASRCGSKWIDERNTQTCYKYSDIRMKWDTADKYCKNLDAKMVIPRSASEQLFLYDKSPLQTNIWLGIHNIQYDGTFATSDGSNVMYTNWAEGEPTNHVVSGDCAVLGIDSSTQSGKWHAASCSSDFIAVCKRHELKTTTTTSTTTTTTVTTTTTTATTTPVRTNFVFELGVCRKDWIFSDVSGSCVKIIQDTSELNVYDVSEACFRMKSQLASMENIEEQMFFKSLAKKMGIMSNEKWNGLWLGGIDAHAESHWEWFMRNTSWSSNYDWAPGQPDNTNEEDCVMMLMSDINYGQLNDLPCDFGKITSGYICQYDPGKACEDDWTYNHKENSCYYLSTDTKTWSEAEFSCHSYNGGLVSIKNELEKFFLKAFTQRRSEEIWIDAYDMGYGDISDILSFYNIDPRADFLDFTMHNLCMRKDFSSDISVHGECSRYYPYICAKRDVSSSGTLPTVSATTSTTAMRTTVLPPADHWHCGAGWEADVLTGICYKFAVGSEYTVTWTEAQQKCAEEDGNLVSIISIHEQAYITGRLQGMMGNLDSITGVWIGLTDSTVEHQWHWNDNEPMPFINWVIGGPDRSNDQKDCTEIVTDISGSFGLWKDVSCDQRKGYICKRRGFSDVTTTKPPRTFIESTSMIEFYQPAEGASGNFKSHDLFELGVRVHDSFQFQVKTERDAFIMLHNKRDDFGSAYYIIIGGWGDTRNIIRDYNNGDSIKDYQNEMLNEYEFRSFWISWNETTILVGKSETVGSSVFLTYPTKTFDINYVSVASGQYTDAYWKIPKYDKYYGCNGKGWVKYWESCFLLVEEQKSWNDAVDYCEKEGGNLASIANENEQNFLLSYLPRDRYCFNIHDNDTECILWAEKRECDINPVWMSTHCHHACGLCMNNCRDIHENTEECLRWASIGECSINHPWMLNNCALSCGVCQGAPTRGYWIGLHSLGYEQSYRWNDKSRVRYTNWDSHQPHSYQDLKGSCVGMLVQNGKWNDGACSDLLSGFICKKPISVVDVMTTTSPFKVGCTMDNSYGYGANCYTYKTDYKSWVDAQTSCESIGGNLAHIDEHYTQAFLASEMAMFQSDYWIGLHMVDSVYSWSGVDNKTMTVFYFRRDNSKTATNGCFALSWQKPVGLWKLYEDCSTKLSYICQSPRDGFTTSTTLATTAPLADCPRDWSPQGSYCYGAADDMLNWRDARTVCLYYGGSLLSIRDDDQNVFAAGLCYDLYDGNCWLGINDIDYEGDFVWEDDNDFENWNYGEPNDVSNEDCAEIIRDSGKWNDVPCNAQKRVICEIPRGKAVNSLPSTTTTPAISMSSAESPFSICPKFWTSFSGSCYKLIADEVEWHAAKRTCETVGAKLVTIHDSNENQFVVGLCGQSTSRACWLGLSDFHHEGGFRWVDDSGLVYENWNVGEPNNVNNEDCVEIKSIHSQWNDVPCSVLKATICKIESVNNESTSAKQWTTTPKSESQESGNVICPYNTINVFDRYCYRVTEVAPFYLGPEFCSTNYIMAMASIQSDMENEAISKWLHRKNIRRVWIGLFGSFHDYSWVDDSSVTYTNFHIEETSFMPGCGLMNVPSGLWNTYNCMQEYPVLCKIHGVYSPSEPEGSTNAIDNTTSFETTTVPTFLSTDASENSSDVTNGTMVTRFRIPPFHEPYEVEAQKGDNSSLTGGQVGGIVIGVLGLLIILGVFVYIVKQRYKKESLYPVEESSLGFDNALFSKDQDTVLIK